MTITTPEDIVHQLNSWQECYDVAQNKNDKDSELVYAKKLAMVHTWFLQNGWIET